MLNKTRRPKCSLVPRRSCMANFASPSEVRLYTGGEPSMKLFVLTALLTLPLAAEVTFNKDVLPILQKHCQACHRPGEVAPMSFLTYKETRPWAKAIKASVLRRRCRHGLRILRTATLGMSAS